MAFYKGEQGSVKFDDGGSSPAAIASTTSWSLTIDRDALETSAMGDTAKGHIGGLPGGSGSIELLYTGTSGDETNAFIEYVNAASDAGGAAFELYTDTSGSKKITFDGVMTSTDYGAAVGETQKVTCSFVTNGAITLSI